MHSKNKVVSGQPGELGREGGPWGGHNLMKSSYFPGLFETQSLEGGCVNGISESLVSKRLTLKYPLPPSHTRAHHGWPLRKFFLKRTTLLFLPWWIRSPRLFCIFTGEMSQQENTRSRHLLWKWNCTIRTSHLQAEIPSTCVHQRAPGLATRIPPWSKLAARGQGQRFCVGLTPSAVKGRRGQDDLSGLFQLQSCTRHVLLCSRRLLPLEPLL